MRALGMTFTENDETIVGTPDFVFRDERVVVFCDGDFWHGRDLERRLAKLARGHNAAYWIAKVQRNVERDREQTASLTDAGWHVVRFWETDVRASASALAESVRDLLATRSGQAHDRS